MQGEFGSVQTTTVCQIERHSQLDAPFVVNFLLILNYY